MKSLNEEIQEIKNAKDTKTMKKKALIKLGLRKHEIDIILQDLPSQARETFKFTFGVVVVHIIAVIAR